MSNEAVSILEFIIVSVIAISGLIEIPDKYKKLRRYILIPIVIILFPFGIWDIINRYSDSRNDKKEVTDTTKSEGQRTRDNDNGNARSINNNTIAVGDKIIKHIPNISNIEIQVADKPNNKMQPLENGAKVRIQYAPNKYGGVFIPCLKGYQIIQPVFKDGVSMKIPYNQKTGILGDSSMYGALVDGDKVFVKANLPDVN